MEILREGMEWRNRVGAKGYEGEERNMSKDQEEEKGKDEWW